MSATPISRNPAYSTQLGAAYVGDSLTLLAEIPDASVNLVLTRPHISQSDCRFG
jgi:site-specific DNA-methyltransferase (cytosine-N4-specific)